MWKSKRPMRPLALAVAAGASVIAASQGATAITIVDLQPDRTVARAEIRRAPDETGSASLTNLNPHINSWFVLTLDWPVSGEHESFHLENPDPKSALTLSANAQGLLRLEIAQNPCQLELGGDSAVLATLEGVA